MKLLCTNSINLRHGLQPLEEGRTYDGSHRAEPCDRDQTVVVYLDGFTHPPLKDCVCGRCETGYNVRRFVRVDVVGQCEKTSTVSEVSL